MSFTFILFRDRGYKQKRIYESLTQEREVDREVSFNGTFDKSSFFNMKSFISTVKSIWKIFGYMKPDVFYFYMFPSKSIHFRGFFFLGRITIKGGRIPPKTGHGKGHPKIEGGCPPPLPPIRIKARPLQNRNHPVIANPLSPRAPRGMGKNSKPTIHSKGPCYIQGNDRTVSLK